MNNKAILYQRQCIESARILALNLNLNNKQYSIAFQSRLGKGKWLTPYSDIVIEQLSKQGVKKLVICCPSFIVDCLETLEEIGIRESKRWKRLGGTSFYLVPCLNSSEVWINNLTMMHCF